LTSAGHAATGFLAMRLVLASNNAKKLAELRPLLSPLAVELISQSALAIAEAEEPHATFVENALAKARHAAQLSGCAAIADDSGLCVAALGGEPGVASAHFAAAVDSACASGVDRETRRARQDAANNTLLLQRLQGVADRRAHFLCTLVAIRHAADPEPLIACGRWTGDLLTAARGEGGFGYDPLVFIAGQGCCVGEMPAAVKNALSHRAIAMRQMRELMVEVWRLRAV
jgi:XTP/dITP diphosphohydrolase